jgi:hypothetical protein
VRGRKLHWPVMHVSLPALASSNSPKYEPADVYEPYEPAVGRPPWPNDPRRTIDSGVGVVPGVPGGVVLGVLFPLMPALRVFRFREFLNN